LPEFKLAAKRHKRRKREMQKATADCADFTDEKKQEQKSYSCSYSQSPIRAISEIRGCLSFFASFCASLQPENSPQRSPQYCPRIEHTRLQIRDEKDCHLYRSALLAVAKAARNARTNTACHDVKPYEQVLSHVSASGRMRPFSTSWHRNCFLSVHHRGEDAIFFSMPARRFSAG
jgi:hypothetical protein